MGSEGYHSFTSMANLGKTGVMGIFLSHISALCSLREIIPKHVFFTPDSGIYTHFMFRDN